VRGADVRGGKCTDGHGVTKPARPTGRQHVENVARDRSFCVRARLMNATV